MKSSTLFIRCTAFFLPKTWENRILKEVKKMIITDGKENIKINNNRLFKTGISSLKINSKLKILMIELVFIRNDNGIVEKIVKRLPEGDTIKEYNEWYQNYVLEENYYITVNELFDDVIELGYNYHRYKNEIIKRSKEILKEKYEYEV